MNRDDWIGRLIAGTYRLERHLGRGTLGPLFEARVDPSPAEDVPRPYGNLNRRAAPAERPAPPAEKVALELLAAPAAGDPDTRAAHLEAITAARHPRLITCRAHGAVDASSGILYAVTDPRPAETLGRLLHAIAGKAESTSPIPEKHCRRLLAEVAEALLSLHDAGQAHGALRLDALYFDSEQGYRLAPPAVGARDFPGDVLALGRVLLQMIGRTDAEIAAEDRPRLTGKLPATWRRILERSLDDDPAARPRLAELLWFGRGIARALPEPETRREPNQFVIRCSPPPETTVRLYRAGQDSTPPEGAFLSAQEVTRALGDPLDPASPEGFQVPVEPGRLSRVVPVLVHGPAALCGRPLLLSPTPDVDNLKSRIDGNELVVTWDWPAEVTHAVIAMRADRFPNTPEECAHRQNCTRETYARGSQFAFQLPAWERAYVTVFAVSGGRGQAELHASGQPDGARVRIEVKPYRRVYYRLDASGAKRFGVYALELRCGAFTTLPELVLRGRSDGLTPRQAHEGLEIGRIAAGTPCAPGEPVLHPVQPPAGGPWRLRLFAVGKPEPWLELVPDFSDPRGLLLWP